MKDRFLQIFIINIATMYNLIFIALCICWVFSSISGILENELYLNTSCQVSFGTYWHSYQQCRRVPIFPYLDMQCYKTLHFFLPISFITWETKHLLRSIGHPYFSMTWLLIFFVCFYTVYFLCFFILLCFEILDFNSHLSCIDKYPPWVCCFSFTTVNRIRP